MEDKSDVYPPSRITDLTVSYNLSISSTAKLPSNILQAVLTWTSPGDDLTTGRASFYEITRVQDPYLLAENKFGQNHSIPVPRDIVPVPLEEKVA